MRFFDCPALGRQVELTDEREEHIESRHEDLLPEHLDELGRALAEPQELVPDPLDTECLWFIRWTDTIKGGRFQRWALRTGRSLLGSRRSASKLDHHGLSDPKPPTTTAMRRPTTVKYDPVSDTLYIDVCPPYKEQESDLIATGVVARSNPQTGEVETLEVMHFQKRFEEGTPFEIPVSLDMRLSRSA